MISVRTHRGEEHLPLEEFEDRVRQGEVPPNAKVRFPLITGEAWVEARDLELYQKLYEPARIYFARAFSLSSFPLLTTLFVAFQVALFFGIAGAERVLGLDALIDAGAKVPANVLELGESWRLFTANVLHRDLVHLGFNMFFLFNVGGTMENVYRREDYLLILVASGLGTTGLSLVMSPLPSVGASGVVLGLFGAAAVFGYKYADILPKRYRRYLTGAVLPYALFVLYVGLATPHTDNWGHVGGLTAGALIALFLEARLLRAARPRRSLLREHAAGLVAASLILAALLLPRLESESPVLTELMDEESGLAVAYPPRWGFGQNHLGYASWGNTLGASIGLRATRDPAGPVSLTELRRRFVEEELRQAEASGDVTEVEVVEERAARVAGARALELVVRLESRAGVHVTRNVLIERGTYGYAVVLSAPARWSAPYADLFDRIVGSIRLVEPARLGAARTVTRIFPGMSSAYVDLGAELASLGEVEAAAEAFQRALTALPEHPEALYGLARLAADYGGDLAAAESIAARLYARRRDDTSVIALLADLRARLGDHDAARAVLEAALERSPDAAELREKLARLREAP